MDLFFYIAIIGAIMLMTSRIQYKKMWDKKNYNYNVKQIGCDKNNFLKKIRNSFLYDLFYSQEFAKMNRTYGTLMVLIGIVGMIVFKTMAIILIALLLVVIVFYLFKFIKKVMKSFRSY